MVSFESVESYLESVKSIGNIVRDLVSLVRSGEARVKIDEVNTKILEVQQFAMSAYSHQLSLSKRISDLEKELMDLKDFRREKQNYELQALGKTAFAYVYKPPVDSAEPAHWLCSTCCNQDHKSILQLRTFGNLLETGYDIWTCHSCDAEIKVANNIKPATLN